MAWRRDSPAHEHGPWRRKPKWDETEGPRFKSWRGHWQHVDVSSTAGGVNDEHTRRSRPRLRNCSHLLPLELLAVVLLQVGLPHPHSLRRDLHQLVVLDVL